MEQTKVCTKCGIEKPLSGFNKFKRGNFGVRSECKECRKKYRQENREAISEYNKKYQEENREAISEYYRKYQEENREATLEYARKYRQKNPHKMRAKEAKRRATKLQATPKWLTEEQNKAIQEVYTHARECEMLTGDEYHVDHIVPLQGENICGLHVPWNLQVLPSDLNQSKSNKYDPDLYGSRFEEPSR